MSELRYTEDHEWVLLDGKSATVGISDYAQEQMGDVVFVELPGVGQALEKGKEAATVESVKAASEVYAPLSGAVTAVNEGLAEEPGLVNSDAEGEGWFFKMTLSDSAQFKELMDEAAYKKYVEGLH